MSPPKGSTPSGETETILGFVVRERLTKEQIADLLASVGASRAGNRDELADRLLSIRGLKTRSVLSVLHLDDLKLIVRRFDVPGAEKPKTAGGYLTRFLTDEKAALIDRIELEVEKQRETKTPEVPQVPAVSEAPPPSALPPPPQREPESNRPIRPALDHTSEPGALHSPAPKPSPAPIGAPATLPAFQETRDFVGSYKFAYQWDSEDLYEAELLGALRGRFGANNAVRQQGESGRVYDIVVRNSARIEVKLPKTKVDLDRMSGQVRRYLSQHPGGVIVVIIGFMMRNQQEIHNAQEDLESAGAVVFAK